MRSIALCVCAFALIACSPQDTGQTTAAIAGGQQGDGTGEGDPSGEASVNSGCTYTQGYWKTHPSAWPVMSLTIGGVLYSEQQLLDLFNTAPKGDASLILAHQLIAGLLNIANSAVPSPAGQQAINDAQTWMAANRGSNAGLPYGVSAGSAAGQQATALTQILNNFNSGLASTAHCGSGSSSGGGSSSGSGSSGSGTSSGSGSSCGEGVTPCSLGANSQCNEGTQCIEGCCLPTPPTPPPMPDAGPVF